MVLNPNLGHFCADEEGAEQIGPTYGDADVPAEFQLRRDHHTGHPCRRHVEKIMRFAVVEQRRRWVCSSQSHDSAVC